MYAKNKRPRWGQILSHSTVSELYCGLHSTHIQTRYNVSPKLIREQHSKTLNDLSVIYCLHVCSFALHSSFTYPAVTE